MRKEKSRQKKKIEEERSSDEGINVFVESYVGVFGCYCLSTEAVKNTHSQFARDKLFCIYFFLVCVASL